MSPLNNKITFTRLEKTAADRLFDVQTVESSLAGVRGFEPEAVGGEIVMPVEFIKTDGEKVLLGFALDKENLRELLK